MSSEISSVAKSRARYYCKGAPVQFVQVELLRINENGNMIVTLTFKNIAPQTLTGFTAHFRCKNASGAVIMEDDFTYANLAVSEGVLFGTDDAVFVSEEPLSSVEVSLVSVQYGPNMSHNLQRCQPVPLPVLKQLSPQTVQAVNTMLQADSARYMPANVADGWQCSCGAFNYNIGHSKDACNECGAVKALLLGAVRAALQGEAGNTQQLNALDAQQTPAANQPQAPVLPAQRLPGLIDWDSVDEPQDLQDPYQSLRGMDDAVPASAGFGDTAQYDKLTDYGALGESTDLYDNGAKTAAIPAQRGREAVSLMQTETADFILKFAPFITLGASAVYVGVMALTNLLLQ